jgi:hypothetical protein
VSAVAKGPGGCDGIRGAEPQPEQPPGPGAGRSRAAGVSVAWTCRRGLVVVPAVSSEILYKRSK